jgi:rRNA-processing protein FCF1
MSHLCALDSWWHRNENMIKHVIVFTNDRSLKELMDKVLNPSEGRKQNK